MPLKEVALLSCEWGCGQILGQVNFLVIEEGTKILLGVFIIRLSTRENAEFFFPEHAAMMTDTYCSGKPGGRGSHFSHKYSQ